MTSHMKPAASALRRAGSRALRIAVPMLVFALLASQALLPAASALAAESEWTRLRVYFPMYLLSGVYVHPVDYLVPVTTTPVKAALEALIAGVPGSPFMTSIPTTTKVLGVSIKDEVATINFSQEMRNLNVGSAGESAVLTAIANTACQFENVSSILIEIEGEPVDSLGGHIDITEPVGPDWEAVFRPMDDVAQHWAGGPILILQSMDIIAGYEDDLFHPEDQVTRAEFIKMLVEAVKLPEISGTPDVPFTDVVSHWSAPYIQRAVSAGLIVPSDYGSLLKPDEAISREEMAYILVEASDLYREAHPEIKFAPDVTGVSFTDLDEIQPKYQEAARESAKRGLINGYPDDSFGPANGLKRSEAATVIARMMEIKGEKIFLQLPKAGFEWDGGNLYVLGSAAAFEANVNFSLHNVDGAEIFESYSTSTLGMGWGAFGICVDARILTGKNPGALEVYLIDMEDGEEFSKHSFSLE
jgi:hypothetical protein